MVMTIGENLKSARLKAALTQADVAKELSIAKSTYCLYETGKRLPDIAKIKQLSKVLGISADDLIGNSVSEDRGASDNVILTPHEKDLILAYRLADDGIKNSVCKLLDVKRGLKEVLDA